MNKFGLVSERDEGLSVSRVHLVDHEQTLVRVVLAELEVLLGRVPPKEDREEGDEDRQTPHLGEHHSNPLRGHPSWVVERFENRQVPSERRSLNLC